MEKYAVIGHPIGHTMSPYIHKELFELKGIKAEYSALDIEQTALANNVKYVMAGLKGFNVTIPHKEQIIPLLDYIDESAAKYNAVNCVKSDGSKLYGCSTDAYGFIKALESGNVDLNGNVLILGAGGAARTLAREATDKGCSVTLAVRDPDSEKVLSLKNWLNQNGGQAKIMALDNVSGKFNLCINATPVGMYPKTGLSPVGADVLKNCSSVFDAVYNPRETEFLKIAKELGLKAVGGMAMLVWQAVKAHEFWYGGKFEPSEVEKIIDAANEEMERMFYAK